MNANEENTGNIHDSLLYHSCSGIADLDCAGRGILEGSPDGERGRAGDGGGRLFPLCGQKPADFFRLFRFVSGFCGECGHHCVRADGRWGLLDIEQHQGYRYRCQGICGFYATVPAEEMACQSRCGFFGACCHYVDVQCFRFGIRYERGDDRLYCHLRADGGLDGV